MYFDGIAEIMVTYILYTHTHAPIYTHIIFKLYIYIYMLYTYIVPAHTIQTWSVK